MSDKWCPENDGAYRAEQAEIARANFDGQIALLIEVGARINTLGIVHAYDKSGWGFDYVSAEDVDNLKEWINEQIKIRT